MTFSQSLNEIFSDMKHRAASLRQLSFLLELKLYPPSLGHCCTLFQWVSDAFAKKVLSP